MEAYQGEIFQLYIIQKKRLEDVIVILKQEYNIDVSPKVLKTKLSKWGYMKNVKRGEAFEVLREKRRRENAGKGCEFMIHQRPVDLRKIERHGHRAGFHLVHQDKFQNPERTGAPAVVCRTPPPSLPTSLLTFESWRVPEKLLHDVDTLVKGSFESGHWGFNGNDLIINSSPTSEIQVFEVKSLHDFLANLDNGCASAKSQDFKIAGKYWKAAFVSLEILIRGQYHDIIPNLIQRINDLHRQGLPDLAEKLKEHIANTSKVLLGPDRSQLSIYQGLGQMDSQFLVDIEERIMARFRELFELYLGPLCYNSFVMMMDGARRRLLQNPWATFEDCLPSTSHIDSVFGAADRRALDVISLRVEILTQRMLYNETELEASILVHRAEMIEGDDWQRFYNLTRGWYFLGQAQYFLQKRDLAIRSLCSALHYADELGKIEDYNIFNAERAKIDKYLEELRGLSSS